MLIKNFLRKHDLIDVQNKMKKSSTSDLYITNN